MTALLHDIEVLDLDLIAPHPRNPRRDLGDLTELTASIKADGVRNAIHVIISTDEQRYVVVQGHRRRQAALDAGHTTIRAVIREDLKTDADALVEMLVENLLRTDLTPIEEATAYEQLRLAGVKAPQIAKRTGRTRATVDARLALMKLPEPARDAVHGAQLSLEDAAALVEFADDEETTAQLLQYVGTRDLAWQIQRAREKKARDARNAAQRLAIEATGTPFVDVAKLIKGSAGSWWGSYRLDSVLDDDDIPGIGGDTGYDEAFDLRRAAHEACPHHAAIVTGDGEPFYVCTDPAVHRVAAAASGPRLAAGANSAVADAAEAAAREAREARWRRNDEDCRTATAIRRQFVTDTIAGRRGTLSPASCTAIALTAAQYGVRAYCETDVDQVATWLELTLPDEPEKATYEQRRAHQETCEQLVIDAMARIGGHRALLAVVAEWSDGPLTSWRTWDADSDEMLAGSAERVWLDLLADLGYEATEWEAARVAAADAHAVDNAGDEDGDG